MNYDSGFRVISTWVIVGFKFLVVEANSRMPINFSSEMNKYSYSNRQADDTWKTAILSLLKPNDLDVVDIGCGGGIYSMAWADLGAGAVTGVDSSPVMVDAARQNCSGFANLTFNVGDACGTSLPRSSADVVFERALIHHLPDLRPCLEEAFRLLKPGGCLVIQDRTPADVSLPGSDEHIRGYLFEAFPALLDIDIGRRRSRETVEQAMRSTGFENVRAMTLWEVRKSYASWEELRDDLRERTGRSILHELNDTELESLIEFLKSKLVTVKTITEKDRWTIWCGLKS